MENANGTESRCSDSLDAVTRGSRPDKTRSKGVKTMKRIQWKKLWLKLFSEYHCMMDPDGDMIIFYRKRPWERHDT